MWKIKNQDVKGYISLVNLALFHRLFNTKVARKISDCSDIINQLSICVGLLATHVEIHVQANNMLIYWLSHKLPREFLRSSVARWLCVIVTLFEYFPIYRHSRLLIKDTIEVLSYFVVPWYSSFYQCFQVYFIEMMTSSNGNIFRVTGHLCGEFTGPRWIPRTKASDAELWCFLWSASE